MHALLCEIVLALISIKSILKLFSFADSLNEYDMIKCQKIVKIIMKCKLYINNPFYFSLFSRLIN